MFHLALRFFGGGFDLKPRSIEKGGTDPLSWDQFAFTPDQGRPARGTFLAKDGPPGADFKGQPLHFLGPPKKGLAYVLPVLGGKRPFACQQGLPVTLGELGRLPWSRQAPELFGTDGQSLSFRHQPCDLMVPFVTSIVAALDASQACAYNDKRFTQ